MKSVLSIIALGAALTSPAFAQDHSAHSGHGAPSASSATAEAALTAGEVTRVDARSGKLTIRHEEIRNLDMPPMTMVFGLKDATQVASFKPGDKLLFQAEDNAGALIITRIQAVQ